MNKRKAKGSVLYTVISVMMVLFVFVMVTLALARAANDRAYNSYNLRQARISAETVAKTVSEAITSNDKSDGLYTAITTKIDAASSDDISIAVSNLPAGMGHLVDPRDHSDKSIVLLEFSGMDRIGQNFISGSGQAIYKVCASVRVGKQIYDYEEYVYQEVTAEQNPNPTPAMLTYGSGTNDQEISLYGGTKTTNADSFIDSTGNLRISSWSDVQADYVNLGYNRFEYQGDEESDLFINSSVRQTHQSTFVLYPQNFAYIKGNLIVDGSDFRVRSITDNITSVIDVPALIIGGGAVFKNKLLLGRAGAGGTDVGGANLVVGTLSTIDNAVLDVRGNIYTFDDCVLNPDGTVNAAANPNYDMNGAPIEKGVNSLYTQASGTTELLDWTATLRANLGGIGGGNVYIGGCLDIKQSSAYKLVVNGDLVVKQNILFKQDTADITVNGNLVVLGGFVKELGDSGIKMTVAGDVYVQDWTNAPTITDESNNVIGDDTWGLADAQARANVYTDYINKLLLNSDSRVKKLEDKQITNYWERTTGGALIELVDDVDWGAEPKPTHLYKSKYDAYATQSQITPAEFAALSEAPAGYKTDAKVTITGDCYLQGTVSAGLIVVDPGGADKIIRIALIDFASSNKCDIVVKTYDGTSKARFFIPGNTNADIAAGFTGTKAAAGNFSLKGSVISDYYLKNPADSYTNFLQSSDLKDNIPLSYQPTVEYNPSINIYMNGVGNFVMDGSNVPYTAFIFAPYSTVELKSIGGVPPMIYDGTTVNDRIMVVGVLVSRILKCSNSSNAAILYIDIALSVDNPPPVYRVLTDSDGQKLYARVYPNAEDPIDRVVYPKMVDKTVVEPPMPVEPYVAADYQLACDLYAPAGVAPTGTLFIAPATFKEAKLEYFKELRKFYDSVATPISTKVNVYPNNEVPDTKKFVWYTPFNNDTVTIRTQEYIIRDQYGSDIGGGGTVSLVVERDGVPVTPTVPDSIPQDIKDANPSVDFSLCTITVFDPTLPLGSGLENQLTEYVQDTAHAIPLYLLDTKGNPLVLSSSGDANGDGIGEDDSGDKKYRKEPSGALLLDYDQKPIRIKNASDYNWKNVSR